MLLNISIRKYVILHGKNCYTCYVTLNTLYSQSLRRDPQGALNAIFFLNETLKPTGASKENSAMGSATRNALIQVLIVV